MKTKFKILIVEDDKILSKYLSASFKEDATFEIITAGDGEQGEKLAKEVKPDLILLDIIMPKQNGFEVLRKIKADPKIKKTPVIMLSNLSQPNDIKKARELEAKDFLVKVDFDPEEIIVKVKALLKGK